MFSGTKLGYFCKTFTYLTTVSSFSSSLNRFFFLVTGLDWTLLSVKEGNPEGNLTGWFTSFVLGPDVFSTFDLGLKKSPSSSSSSKSPLFFFAPTGLILFSLNYDSCYPSSNKPPFFSFFCYTIFLFNVSGFLNFGSYSSLPSNSPPFLLAFCDEIAGLGMTGKGFVLGFVVSPPNGFLVGSLGTKPRGPALTLLSYGIFWIWGN